MHTASNQGMETDDLKEGEFSHKWQGLCVCWIHAHAGNRASEKQCDAWKKRETPTYYLIHLL